MLGVTKASSQAEIKERYLELVKKHHPDALYHSEGSDPGI